MQNYREPIESPLGDYPGAVRFPHPFRLSHYQQWYETRQAREELPKMNVFAFGDGGDDTIYQAADWIIALTFCDMSQLQNVPPECIQDTSGLSTPYDLASWLIPLSVNYINDQFDPKKRRSGDTKRQ